MLQPNIKSRNFRGLRCRNERLSRFSYKTSEKVTRQKPICLNLNPIIFIEKWKMSIRRILTFVVMLSNFIHFPPKVGFKIVYEVLPRSSAGVWAALNFMKFHQIDTKRYASQKSLKKACIAVFPSESLADELH